MKKRPPAIQKSLVAKIFAITALILVVAGCQLILGIDPNARSDANGDTGADASLDAASDSAITHRTDSAPSEASAASEDACLGHSDCPPQIESAKLQLWLRGNVGLNCGAGRVAVWSDQSGRGNDATAASFLDSLPLSKPLTPKCGLDKLDGHDVVTFSAPAEPDGGDSSIDFVDETLAVDMNWIVGVDYTVFVVHRRSADTTFGLLAQDRSFNDACEISGSLERPQEAFELDYQRLDDAGNGVGLHQFCGRISGSFGSSPFDTYGPDTAVVDEVVFDVSTGHRVYSNGVLVASGLASLENIQPISAYSRTDAGLPGVIGRGSDAVDVDTRYQGDIAEIIGYSTALSDNERTLIESYLKRQWGVLF